MLNQVLNVGLSTSFICPQLNVFLQAGSACHCISCRRSRAWACGEIQVVIEGSLPSRSAYYQDTLCRARQLFAELGVWDTEHNSGVLIYLNLCDHKVEIVIDRGIKNATTQQVWDEICQNIIQHLVQQKFKEGVIEGVKQIGKVLDQYYDRKIDDLKNELGNKPIILG